MTDIEHLLARKSDCPSEAILDRLHWGELDESRAASLRAHLAGCVACQQRMELRRKGFDAFAQLDADGLRARIVEAAAGQAAAGPPKRRSLVGSWLVPAVAAACALLLVVTVFIQTGQRTALRTKGGLALQVFRERDGRVDSPRSQAAFHPGDRLRFGLDLPRDSHVMIVGAEQSGQLYVCFPSDGSRTSRPRPAGRAQQLPGAVRLDASTGTETLHAVVCPRPFSLDELRPNDPAGGLSLPRGCSSCRFVMHKIEP